MQPALGNMTSDRPKNLSYGYNLKKTHTHTKKNTPFKELCV